MPRESVKPETVASLAAKLERLDLDEAELVALDGILERASGADADVEGFGVVYEVETTYTDRPDHERVAADNKWVHKVGRATGMDLGKLGVWTDMRP